MTRICGLIATLICVGLGAGLASAATIAPPPASTLEVVGVTGAWIGTTDGMDVRGIDTASITWGRPSKKRVAQSGYRFDGVDDGTPQMPGTDFKLGTFTHNNRVIDRETAVTSARLQVSFDVMIQDLASGLSRLVSAVSTFDFRHWETINDDQVCADGAANRVGVNVNGCADRVTLTLNPRFSDTFRLGNLLYTLDISGFDRTDPFWTTEDQANRADLIGRFTATPSPSPVPLPATGFMLMAGILGLGGLIRRHRPHA